jgi:hypothetical protein
MVFARPNLFRPFNETSYPYPGGSDTDLTNVIKFIINRLETVCGAPANTVEQVDTVAASDAEEADAGGAQADAWNADLGIKVFLV